jgi:four helix bundle protein
MSAERNNGLESRTKQFALWVIELYSELPTSTVAQVLGRQTLRSGTSVGAHYREAIRAKSRADFVNKLEGALQELEETRYWFDLLTASKTLTNERVALLVKEAEELTRMLVASARTAKRNRP